MKNYRLLFIMMAAVMFAVSCTEDEALVEDLSAKKATFYDTERWDAIDFCGTVRYHDLIGGQDILMGSVAVGNTADTLYVKYQADSGYVITETHLFVGDVMDEDFPKTKKGNPKIGHFPFASEKLDGSTVVVYSIPFSKIEGDCFDIAAHAVVECEDGTCEETAWGAGRQTSELILAAKAQLLTNYGAYAYTRGLMPDLTCDWGTDFGFIPIDLDSPNSVHELGLYFNNSVKVAKVTVDIVDDKITAVMEPLDGVVFDASYFYLGSEAGLNSIIAEFGCPDFYKEFPYTDFAEISILDVTSSIEAQSFDAARWGFYFDYCISTCTE